MQFQNIPLNRKCMLDMAAHLRNREYEQAIDAFDKAIELFFQARL
jgi:hypothetical protein